MSEGFRRQVLDFAERKATPDPSGLRKGCAKTMSCTSGCGSSEAREEVVFIGIAQEKARVPRTIRKGFGEGEGTIPWIDYTTAIVKHYLFLLRRRSFGAFYIKFCSFFPYTGKLCINGHGISTGNWPSAASNSKRSTTGSCVVRTRRRRSASRRLSMKRRSRDFSASGSQYCRSPIQRQTERPAFATGFRCCRRSFPSRSSDRPRHGRNFFEEVIQENIDLGRPETVQLIFARKMRRSTVAGGRCRTRISYRRGHPFAARLYKNTHLKQYHKTGERGAGLRTRNHHKQ